MIEESVRSGFAVLGLLFVLYHLGRWVLLRNRRSVTMRARLKRRLEQA